MTKPYWIVFMQNEKWWGHLLKKGFSHVCVIFKDDYGFWMLFNPTDQKLKIELVPFTEKDQNSQDYPRTLRKSGYHVIKIEKIEEIHRFSKIRGYHIKLGLCFNCVTLCRYFMSIGVRRITPYGFYKELVRLGQTKNYKERYQQGISSIQVFS